MDQYPPAPKQQNLTPNVPNDTVNRFHGLVSWKVGLLEFSLGIIVLLLVFVVLNYFNILSISSAFPDQLGWLPHQTNQQPQPKTSQNTSPYKPTVAPAPTIPDSIVTNVKSLMGDVLMPSFLPSSSSFMIQGIENSNNSNTYSAGASWVGSSKERFSTTIKYNQNQLIAGRQMSIYISQAVSNLDASKSALLAGKYIKIDPQATFNCKSYLPTSQLISCESFWEEANGIKRGIHISSPLFESNESQIFYCEFHKNDPNYSRQSCSEL